MSDLVKSQLECLDKGSRLLNITISSEQRQKVEHYLGLLLFWNEKVNLFSANDSKRLVERHILESLAWIPSFRERLISPIMDLGSGAGFPGIPVSILHPDLEVVLVESKKKKANILKKVTQELELNIIVYPNRIEELIPQSYHRNRYRMILARAVASLSKLFNWTYQLLQKNGNLVTFKGDKIAEELEELETDYAGEYSFNTRSIQYFTPIHLNNKSQMQERRLLVITKN